MVEWRSHMLTFKRDAVDIAVQPYSVEKDSVTFVIPVENSTTQRSIAKTARVPDSKSKTTLKSSVIRMRDVVTFAGTPAQGIAPVTIRIDATVPKGAAQTDVVNVIKDSIGLLSHAELVQLFSLGYLFKTNA